MRGTLKQEVDTEEEEAALFDNTKWCKNATKCDTCWTLIPITELTLSVKTKMQRCLNLHDFVLPEDNTLRKVHC